MGEKKTETKKIEEKQELESLVNSVISHLKDNDKLVQMGKLLGQSLAEENDRCLQNRFYDFMEIFIQTFHKSYLTKYPQFVGANNKNFDERNMKWVKLMQFLFYFMDLYQKSSQMSQIEFEEKGLKLLQQSFYIYANIE